MSKILKAKKCIEDFSETLGTLLEKEFNITDEVGDSIEYGIKHDIAEYMMYLSASDGKIVWEETQLISELLDETLSPNQIGNYIRKNNIYSTEFEQTIPETFKLILDIDKSHNCNLCSELVIKLYEGFGIILINADNNVDDNEALDYRTYIRNLKEYRNKYLSDVMESSTGFTKN